MLKKLILHGHVIPVVLFLFSFGRKLELELHLVIIRNNSNEIRVVYNKFSL